MKTMTADDFRKWMDRMGLTTLQVAKITGQSRGTIYRYAKAQPPTYWRHVCIGVETEMIKRREAKRAAEQR